MAPVVRALRRRSQELETIVIATAQHRQMLDQVLELFEITPDIDLNVMQPQQTLSDLTCRVMSLMNDTLRELSPDMLLVQGDTTTVFGSAMAAFYNRIPVGHIEAGLRSYDIHNPFPEEINRRLTTVLAKMHFAPTALSRDQLLQEGVCADNILITGNTVVDALHYQLDRPFRLEKTPLEHIPMTNRRILLVTSHRRESWGNDLQNICLAIKLLVERFSDLIVVYPVHMNPVVQKTAHEVLGNTERIFLTGPLDYHTFIHLMKRSYLILTDSGGVQEEAPTLRKPLLVLRKLTERPEAMQAGMAKVVGARPELIVQEAAHLLNDPVAYASMIRGENPFGDGHAGERIVQYLLNMTCQEHASSQSTRNIPFSPVPHAYSL
ncbi:MAG: UDP-N-acetylglucosamine 2-epimerase [Omnitrophica WOR_2 bacterium GWA2_45_18]|nr:MAG: UDP-N-acetylglucosamine 2-epimerase [Omnitrophica WOR_2 bacterium GWA2_45_18]